MTDSIRSMQARSAAHTSWANTANRSARTDAARKASKDRFATQVDPEGLLDPRERAIRAEHARKAYYMAMAAKSVQVRRRRAQRKKAES